MNLEAQARLGDRAFFADAGRHIAERPALGNMVEDIVDGNERRAVPFAEFGEASETARLVATVAVDAG